MMTSPASEIEPQPNTASDIPESLNLLPSNWDLTPAIRSGIPKITVHGPVRNSGTNPTIMTAVAIQANLLRGFDCDGFSTAYPRLRIDRPAMTRPMPTAMNGPPTMSASMKKPAESLPEPLVTAS